MSDDSWIKLIDWGGWVVSNVVIGAFFPIVGMGLMHLIRKISNGNQKIDYFAPFRDGQLGFVSVGWVVASLVEILKWSVTHKGVSFVFYTILLLLAASVSALIAAQGAVSPVQPPAQRPKGFGQWFDAYPAFVSSAIVCVPTLVLTAIVHGSTS